MLTVRVFCRLFSLSTIKSKNGIFCDDISFSNLIALCFLLILLVIVVNCSFSSFHMINSNQYDKYKTHVSLIYVYIRFSSNCAINKLAYKGAHTLLISRLIFCMQLNELNRKLFKVKIELRKVVIIFVKTNLLGCFSSAPFTAFIPSWFDMLVP